MTTADAPAPDSKVLPILFALAILALLGAGAATLWLTPITPEQSQVANTGPLHAHYGQIGNRYAVICDEATGSASNDGRQGVSGTVHMAGPGVVSVTVRGQGRVRHGQQQVTARDDGMTFDFPLTAPADKIEVTGKSGNSSGTCEMVPPTYPFGTRSNTLGGIPG